MRDMVALVGVGGGGGGGGGGGERRWKRTRNGGVGSLVAHFWLVWLAWLAGLVLAGARWCWPVLAGAGWALPGWGETTLARQFRRKTDRDSSLLAVQQPIRSKPELTDARFIGPILRFYLSRCYIIEYRYRQTTPTPTRPSVRQ